MLGLGRSTANEAHLRRYAVLDGARGDGTREWVRFSRRYLVPRDHGVGTVPRARAVFKVSTHEGFTHDVAKPRADARGEASRRETLFSRASRVRHSVSAKGSVQTTVREQAARTQVSQGGEKKADWLAKTLLDNIPSLGERTRMLAEREARRRKESNAEGEEQAEAASNEAYKHGVSNWNFDVEELKAQAASMDDPTVAESDALAAANALDNLNLGSDKKGVEKKGRFEIITESSTPDQPQEQSQTPQPVQRRGRFDIIEESKGASRSVSPSRTGSPALSRQKSVSKGPVQKGRFTVHSDGDTSKMGVDLRHFSEAVQSASSLHNVLRDLYEQARAQESAIEELQDENARLPRQDCRTRTLDDARAPMYHYHTAIVLLPRNH